MTPSHLISGMIDWLWHRHPAITLLTYLAGYFIWLLTGDADLLVAVCGFFMSFPVWIMQEDRDG